MFFLKKKVFKSHHRSIWFMLGGVMVCMIFFQFISGFCMMLHYIPTCEQAWFSLGHFKRHIEMGHWVHKLHRSGAHILMILMYLHLGRGLIFKSYRYPSTWVWGVVLYALLLLSLFTGQCLPWSQLSYWSMRMLLTGLQQHVGFLFPEGIEADDLTLRLAYAWHVIAVPWLLVMAVAMHVMTLHRSQKPIIDAMPEEETVSFFPHHVIKVGFVFLWALLIWSIVALGLPEPMGASAEPSTPHQTPQDLKPEWYFLPFYYMMKYGYGLGFVWITCFWVFLIGLPFLMRFFRINPKK